MKIYLVSLVAGFLVGVVYGLLGVRSPAPPLVALFGLLGILVGEQTYAVARRALSRQPITVAWLLGECAPKVTGVTPPPAGKQPAGE